MKDINYYLEKMNEIDFEKNYTDNTKLDVSKYFYNLFDDLSKMYIVNSYQKRELSQLEKFLYMYINITSMVKDHNDDNTSHDVIGSISTGKAVCQGYSNIMKFICNELSIPFLYKNMEGPFGAHGNFQVILEDSDGIKHCLHCDPYIDSPDDLDDTITFNATLISANDINNYQNHQEPSSNYLFWEFVNDTYDFESKKRLLESLSIIEEFSGKKLEDVIDKHYQDLKEEIIELNKFFNIEIGSLDTNEDILKAYFVMKNYYNQLNIDINRDELFSIIKQIYISYDVCIENINYYEALVKEEDVINKQIENTISKYREKWTK